MVSVPSESNPEMHERLQVAMMGNGQPRRYLTSLRKRLLRCLLDDPSELELGHTLGLAPLELTSELEALTGAGLVARTPEGVRPTFLVVAAAEVAPVTARAETSAAAQAALLHTCWPDLLAAMGGIEMAGWSMPELAFFLVGNWLLDQGVLEALADDGELMPPAPARPAPEDPNARYYLWMVEGGQTDLGRYGQRAHTLPWEGWYLITFGEYGTGSQTSGVRAALEARGLDLAQQGGRSTPDELARAIGVPAFSQELTAAWLEQVYPTAEALVGLYRGERSDLENLYGGLGVSHYLPNGMGEFMCWYDHLVFARTIDLLAAQDKLAVPTSRFVAALWQVKI